ncbi:MAG: hypothetical protein KC613_22535 [Myxococcales bacterium]|nr:hypothetical protein [Myxococcales bacterium]
MLAVDGGSACLWPALRDEKWHAAKRIELGRLAYAQEILLKPISNETSLFPPELFTQHPGTLRDDLRLGRWTLPDIREAGLSVFIGVDVAISAEVGSDYTVIAVAGVDDNRNRYLIDLIRFRGLSFQAQLERIKSTSRKYDADLVFIEANQMQVLFSAELQRTTDLPVKPFVTGADKRSLTRGVASLRPLFENGKWGIPRGDRESIEATDVLLGELKDFAVVDGRLEGVGNHDDTVMALWICDQAVRASVFGFLGSSTISDKEVAEELRRREAELAAGARADGAAQAVLAQTHLASQPELDVPPPGQTRWDGPRINPALYDWTRAAEVHPEGMEGCMRDAATLPDDAATLIRSYNELATGAPRRVDLDAAVDQLFVEQGREVAAVTLRVLVG